VALFDTLRTFFKTRATTRTGCAPKVSFVTRVGDLGCGVGYYK